MAAQIQEKRLSHSVCRTPEPEVDSDGDLDFEYRPSAKLRRASGPCHRAIQSPGIRHQSFGVLVNSYRRAGSKSASLLNRPHYLWSSRRFLCVSTRRLGRTPSAGDGRCSARHRHQLTHRAAGRPQTNLLAVCAQWWGILSNLEVKGV